MNVVKWECPGYPGNDQVFPCPYFEAHGFSVRGDFHTDVWPAWATVPFQWWTAHVLIFQLGGAPLLPAPLHTSVTACVCLKECAQCSHRCAKSAERSFPADAAIVGWTIGAKVTASVLGGVALLASVVAAVMAYKLRRRAQHARLAGAPEPPMPPHALPKRSSDSV